MLQPARQPLQTCAGRKDRKGVRGAESFSLQTPNGCLGTSPDLQGRSEKSGSLRRKQGTGESMYVGIDVSKKTLDVAVRPSGEQWSQGNDDVSIAGLCERLQALKPRIIVL